MAQACVVRKHLVHWKSSAILNNTCISCRLDEALRLRLWQVGCMPWLWGGANASSSIVIVDADSDANRTAAELPCDGASYAFLSCVVGTLTLALFLRVSWLPKMALMLLLGVLYVTVLELSGFRKTAG